MQTKSADGTYTVRNQAIPSLEKLNEGAIEMEWSSTYRERRTSAVGLLGHGTKVHMLTVYTVTEPLLPEGERKPWHCKVGDIHSVSAWCNGNRGQAGGRIKASWDTDMVTCDKCFEMLVRRMPSIVDRDSILYQGREHLLAKSEPETLDEPEPGDTFEYKNAYRAAHAAPPPTQEEMDTMMGRTHVEEMKRRYRATRATWEDGGSE